MKKIISFLAVILLVVAPIYAETLQPSRMGGVSAELTQRGEYMSWNGALDWRFEAQEQTPANFDLVRLALVSTARPQEDVHLELSFDWEGNGRQFAMDYGFVDYLLPQQSVSEAILRVGIFRVPIGHYNEYVSKSLFKDKFYSTPYVLYSIIPSNYSDSGVQLRGILGEKINYSVYMVNGLQELSSTEANIRNLRSNNIDTNEKSYGARLGFVPNQNTEIGISGYRGEIDFPGTSTRHLTIYDLDFRYDNDPLEIRGEIVSASHAAPAGHLSKGGFYIEANMGAGQIQPGIRLDQISLSGAAVDNKTRISPLINIYVRKNLWFGIQYDMVFNQGTDVADNVFLACVRTVF